MKAKIINFKKTKRKKFVIAFICTSLNNVAGGLERQLVRVANQLSKYDLQVLILSYDNQPSVSFYKISDNVPWIKCGNGLVPHNSANLFARLKQIYNLRKILIQYSITHLITFHHGLFPRSFLACLFLPIIKIVSERNSLQNYKYIKLRKYNAGFLSLFLADKITVQIKSYIKDYPKYIRHKIEVVPNLLYKKKIYQEPLLNESIISMLGRLCPQKNFIPLLDQCLENINEIKNLKIRIAGDGDYRELFEKKYRLLISNGILELLGNIKNTEKFLKGSTIFCLPSLWEGYPNSLVEALSYGLPVILSSRLKNLNDFVENDSNGKIVDDSEYLSTIIKMLKNKDKLKLMSLESFSKYNSLLSKSSIDNWINIIK